MRLLTKRRCRMCGYVMDMGIRSGCFGGPEIGYIYSVGTDVCFRIPDLRRLDEEVDELMGSDVPTARGTSACTSEKKSVQ